jgi:SdpC family antimicrobial peptide
MSACDAPLAPTAHVVPKDGETLFRGLVFGEGEVAKAFPEIWGGKKIDDPSWTAEQRDAVVKVKTELIADMRTADPGFFDRYAGALQSGDHLRIERMLDESGKLFRQVADSRITTSQSGNRGSATGTCIVDVLFVVVALFINVAAGLNFVVDANFVVAANLVYYTDAFWGDGNDGGDPIDKPPLMTKLQRDQVVNMLAVRLAQ